MNIPKGTGWQELRAACLAAIPEGSAAPFTRPVPLHEWRRRGIFRVASCSRREIALETAGAEIGSALLSDAEHLMDNAAEHHATLRAWIEERVWHSPGWALVTVYYWSFFLGMSLSRLVGQTSWFLDRAAIADLRLLASSIQQPPAGALDLNIGPYVSATDRRVLLFPSGLQLHDAVWRRVGHLFGRMFAASDANTSPLEYRMLRCIENARSRVSARWPSLIRNAVNYRPGCGYREVLRRTDVDVGRYLKQSLPLNMEDVVSEFETGLLRVAPGMPLIDDVPLFCRLLIIFTLTMAAINANLHVELLDRNSLDRRWLVLRNNFLRTRGVLHRGGTWPFAD